jgi:hypothetical protein
VGDNLMSPVLRGKRARWLGSLDLPHTLNYLEDMARALVTLGAGGVTVVKLAGPPQRVAQVGPFGHVGLVPVQLVRASEAGVAGFCPRHVVGAVMTPRAEGFAADLDALLAVLAEGFKLTKPCAERPARRRKQRLVDQGAQQILDHSDNPPR